MDLNKLNKLNATKPSFESYVGIPWRDDYAASRAGCGCYGLLELFYREQYGITLAQFTKDNYQSAKDREWIESEIAKQIAACWQHVEIARIGDAVTFLDRGVHSHIGIVLSPHGSFLHTREGKGAEIDNFNSIYWRSVLVGFWRHQDRI